MNNQLKVLSSTAFFGFFVSLLLPRSVGFWAFLFSFLVFWIGSLMLVSAYLCLKTDLSPKPVKRLVDLNEVLEDLEEDYELKVESSNFGDKVGCYITDPSEDFYEDCEEDPIYTDAVVLEASAVVPGGPH